MAPGSCLEYCGALAGGSISGSGVRGAVDFGDVEV